MAFSIEIGWWIAFLVMSFLFSGMEVAFVASDKLRFAVTKKEKGVYNFMLNALYEHPRQFLSTLSVAKMIVLIFFVYFTMLLAYYRVFDYQVPDGWVLLLVILFVAFVILLVEEFLPRILFKKNPNFWVRVFALPAFIIYVLLYPIARAFIILSKWLLALVGIRSSSTQGYTYGRVDLDAYVKQSIDDMSKEGEVDSEVKIFRNALDFTTTKLRDCMVPRPEIVAVSIDTDLETQRNLSRQEFHGSSCSKRILTISWDIFICGKSLITQRLDEQRGIALVCTSMQANQLMSDLMQQRKSIAVVVDEFGGTSGIVTMEDLVEEIFGEIEDEYDVKSKFVKKEAENEYVLSGRVEIDYLNEQYGLELPDSDEYSTVAGYLLHHAGRFPKTYEIITIGEHTFKIQKVTARKIEVVRLIIEDAKGYEGTD